MASKKISSFFIPSNSGVFYPEMPEFGAAASYNSSVDDTPAVSAALAATIAAGGTLFLGRKYRITSELNGFSSKQYFVEGGGRLCGFEFDFEGVSLSGLSLTNVSSPTTRGAPIGFRDISFRYHSNVTSGLAPKMFEQRVSSGLYMCNVAMYGYKDSTLMSVSDMWNVDFDRVELWGGGVKRPFITIPDTTTFSISSGGTTLTSNEDIFTSDCVGKYILIVSTSAWNYNLFLISGYTDARTVTVSNSAKETITAKRGNFEGVRGSISASTNILTFNAPAVTSDDVGRVVYIPEALSWTSPSSKKLLRTTITAVNSSTEVVLNDNATNTVSDKLITFSPSAEFYDDPVGDTTNDLHLSGFHIEQGRGTLLVAQACQNLKSQAMKLHANNSAYNSLSSNDLAYFDRCNGYIDGEFTGGCTNKNRIIINGSTTSLAFNDVVGSGHANDQTFIRGTNNYADSSIQIGNLRFNDQNFSIDGVKELLSDDGTGQGFIKTGGCLMPYAIKAGIFNPTTVSNSFQSCDRFTPFSLTDDNFYKIQFKHTHGIIGVYADISNGHSLIGYAASIPELNILSQPGTLFEVNTVALNGTTGTDGKITVSIYNNELYIENRYGSAIDIHFVNFGNNA